MFDVACGRDYHRSGGGGAELRQLTVAHGINRKKIMLDFYCIYDDDNSLIGRFEELGYTVNVVKIIDYSKHFLLRFNLFALMKLVIKLRNGGYDLVHTQLHHANTVGRIASRFAGIKKIVATICDMEYRSSWQIFWDRVLGKYSTTIMCVSESVKKHDMRLTKLPDSKYTVIYNGIDEKKFSRSKCPGSLKSELKVDETNFIIGTVARLHPVKDLPTLIRAISSVLETRRNVLLVIAGEGREMKKLKALCEELDVADKVCFLGKRLDIPYILSSFDLFVSSSVSEGFANTVLEAMSMELPVITTDIPACREMVNHSVNGILIPLKDHRKLSRAILDVIDDPEKRIKIGKKGREAVCKKFSQDHMVKNLERLYLGVHRR